MAAFQPKKLYTLEDYLELERTSEEKFEFYGGTVWSMSGVSENHDQIAINLLIEVSTQLRNKGCRTHTSDMRIKVPDYPPYRYPDLSALCGEAVFEKLGGIDVLVNPQLIVEVLSESTAAFDRGDKFTYYKSIESFSEYLLIAQHRPHVTQFVRQGDGFWINTEANSLEDTITLKSVPCELTLTAIYRDVSFEKAS
jgi:Uma2 family endonuclease